MPDSTEVTLARMEERIKNVQEELQEARLARKGQYETNETFRSMLRDTNAKVDNIEKSVAKSAPTIEEFITIKHKVVGAGIAGRWVWAAAGIIIGMMAATKSWIFAWLSSGPPHP